MRILHIIDSGGMFGAEAVLLNLVAEQLRLGLEPVIASIGERNEAEKPLETEAIRRGFKVKKFRMRPGPNFIGMLAVLRYAQREGFDLLHSHGYKGNVAFGFMPKSVRRIPLIATLHGYTSTNGFSKNKLYEWADYHSHRFIDAVVLVHNGMLTNPKLGNRKNVSYHVVNNGLPLNHLPIQPFSQSTNSPFNHSTIQPFNYLPNSPFNKEIADFCSHGFTIGSIGRLSSEKGYGSLLSALGLVVKSGVDARLAILGEGYLRRELESQAAGLGLRDRVLMPGYIPNAGQYIRLFQVYVISSLTEGLPITLLEAMQAKVPVVATAVGGIPEVLEGGKAGILVGPVEPELLANAILKIHDNRSMAENMVKTAFQRLVSCFSSASMANGYFKLYQSLLHLPIYPFTHSTT